MSKQVLVVDDDAHIREVVRFALEKAGMRVVEAANGREALAQVSQQTPDLVILDIMMPEMDGLETCREIRKTSDLPILFLSSRDDEIDRVLGLEIGGDDYVTKPFSPRELVARVNVMFRWLQRQATPKEAAGSGYRHGLVALDTEAHTVTWQEKPVILTATEFSLLETFLRTPNKVFSRDDLIRNDTFRDIVTDRTVDSHIRRLRKKFAGHGCDNVIETVHGVGYKLGGCR